MKKNNMAPKTQYRVFQKFVRFFIRLNFTDYLKKTFCKTKYVIHYSFNIE